MKPSGRTAVQRQPGSRYLWIMIANQLCFVNPGFAEETCLMGEAQPDGEGNVVGGNVAA